MSNSENFCLRWNDFKENVNTTFALLRKDTDFADVTLACEDGYQVDAHKIVLGASSPIFHILLKRNIHAHPLIYMQGMKSENLLAIVDFMYNGKANIYQENLDTFLNIAEELQLKGLHESDEEDEEEIVDGNTPLNQNGRPTDPQMKTDKDETKNKSHDKSFISQSFSEDHYGIISEELHLKGLNGTWEQDGEDNPLKQIDAPTVTRSGTQRKNKEVETENTLHDMSLLYQSFSKHEFSSSMTLPKDEFSGKMNERDEKIETIMYKGENKVKSGNQMVPEYICKVCGKKNRRTYLKNHIESNHLEGISFPCNICEKTSKTRSALKFHKSHFHDNRSCHRSHVTPNLK